MLQRNMSIILWSWATNIFLALHVGALEIEQEKKPLVDRRQYFELLDFAVVPDCIRQPIYTSLAFTQHIAGLRDVLEKEVFPHLVALGSKQIIELGSGSGKNIFTLARHSARRGYSKEAMSFIITDKFPSPARWSLSKGENIIIYEQPLGFEEILTLSTNDKIANAPLTFLLVSASHHMNDPLFKTFLKHSAALKANIIIVEPIERLFSHALLSIGGSLAGLLVPFMAGLSLYDRITQFLVYYSGIGIAIQSYDGVISTLRQRTEDEFVHQIGGLPYTITQKVGLGTFASYSVTVFKFTLATPAS